MVRTKYRGLWGKQRENNLICGSDFARVGASDYVFSGSVEYKGFTSFDWSIWERLYQHERLSRIARI